ncbi:MAG TPA: DUF3352 domain-containing protein [Aggregatilineales bacterium]|nr:DUF3352 domain-containing protein [Anaerolineales bacterium]HRE49018.1 DUF3352 domain-containing protein [Aggregatilineales bacterium]
MKRLLFLLLCAVLVIPLMIPMSAAQAGGSPHVGRSTSASANADLAGLFDAGSLLYIALRTDDGYLKELGDLASAITLKATGRALPPLETLLQLGLANSGFDYQQDIRSWVGDQAAFGIGNLSRFATKETITKLTLYEAPILLAIEVKDKAKAEAFIDKLLANARIELEKSPGEVIAWDADVVPVAVQLSSDLLLIGTTQGISRTLMRDRKLNQDPAFQYALGLLSAPAYNALVYVDTPQLGNLLRANIEGVGGNFGPSELVLLHLGALGQLAVGATILDGRSFVLDVAQVIDPKMAAEMSITPGTRPINEAFLKILPRSGLIAQSADFPKQLDLIIGALIAQTRRTSGLELTREGIFAEFSKRFHEATGLDLNADVLANLADADYASFIRYIPPPLGQPTLFDRAIDPQAKVSLKDFATGIAFQIKDPAKGEALKKALYTSLERAKTNGAPLEFGTKQIGTVEVKTVTISAAGLPEPLSVVVDYIGEAFVIATANTFDDMEIFGRAPLYEEARAYALPNATSVFYMDQEGLTFLMDANAASAVGTNRIFRRIMRNLQTTATPESPDAELVEDRRIFQEALANGRKIATVLSTSTISTAASPKGDALIRFVVTVAR